MAASVLALSATSQWKAMPLTSIATSAAALVLTSRRATLAPAAASMRAVAAPRPEPPPVTGAACPRISLINRVVLWAPTLPPPAGGGGKGGGDDDIPRRRVGVKLFDQ